MALPAVPVIIGVADVRNKSMEVKDAIEPAQLMVDAVRRAVENTGVSRDARKLLYDKIDVLRVVPTWTWPYRDLPTVISRRLGINPSRKVVGEHGGNQPALQCDAAASDIAARKSCVSILTGGEALASLSVCQKAEQNPPQGWPEPEADRKPISLDLSDMQHGPGTLHSMGLPIHVYPLYENARRAHLAQSHADNNRESADMYAEFDEIASKNKHSWNHGTTPKTAQQIGSVSPKNRMICDPYPLLMNAYNTVNMSAACVLTSTETAEMLGISKDKWIYVLGGAGMNERSNFWERRCLHRSEAIGKSIDTALDASGLSSSDIDCFDFYSCFPIVPKLACDHVGLSTSARTKPITLLGGLSSFGGAGNNYSMHAITAMSRAIRSRSVKNGLILANGGVLTYQHALCLSSKRREDGLSYSTGNELPSVVDEPSPLFTETAEGSAFIETYTVEYNRDGTPNLAMIVGRLRRTGHRFLANHADGQTLMELTERSVEHVGRTGRVKVGEDGRNLFSLDIETRL